METALEAYQLLCELVRKVERGEVVIVGLNLIQEALGQFHQSIDGITFAARNGMTLEDGITFAARNGMTLEIKLALTGRLSEPGYSMFAPGNKLVSDMTRDEQLNDLVRGMLEDGAPKTEAAPDPLRYGARKLDID